MGATYVRRAVVAVTALVLGLTTVSAAPGSAEPTRPDPAPRIGVPLVDGLVDTVVDPLLDPVLDPLLGPTVDALVDSLVIPADGFGFADGMKLVQMSPADLERQLEAVSRTSAEWLRVPFNWSLIETRQGTFDWTQVDRVVDRARAHGLTVLANLAYAPTWARAAGTTGTGPPRAGRTYATFARAAAQHFAGRVRHFEVWNEPNLVKFFGGPTTHERAPEKYTRLLKKGFRAIKAAQPRSVVVAGALAAGTDSAESHAMSTFVRRMYAAGAERFFDALSLHPYTTTSPASWSRVYGDVTAVRRLMRAQGNGDRKIWYTEFGHTSPLGGLSQTAQAAWVVKELSAAARRRYVGPAFVYAIRDSGTNRLDYGQNFGSLLTHDFQPKVLSAVLSLVAALPRR